MKKEKSTDKPSKAHFRQHNYRHQLVPIKKISIKEAMEMFQKLGIDVQEEEAKEIMEFLYTITQITIKEFFSHD